ncbi:hypothetical protein [Cerasicoccus frondis]|uniref:hypothetical protein n=1 Tax=Cerasicoccus frondis TaxID=490090 RepID=UPI002852B906|nr:hypothetical protein [Cerasicoccus frondis]
MIASKSIAIFILSLLVSAISASGQGNQPDVYLKFRALALNYPHNSGIYLAPTGGSPIRIYSNSRTDWVEYSGPNPITFYVDDKNAKNESIRTPIASVDISMAPESPLLVFSKSSAEDKFYNISVIDDSVEISPPGSYRIFNFTTKQIAGMIDDQKFLLSPKTTAYAKVSNPKDFEVTVKLAESANGKAKRLYASTWTFSENFRYLVMIIPSNDRTRGNIDIRLIPDLIHADQS